MTLEQAHGIHENAPMQGPFQAMLPQSDRVVSSGCLLNTEHDFGQDETRDSINDVVVEPGLVGACQSMPKRHPRRSLNTPYPAPSLFIRARFLLGEWLRAVFAFLMLVGAVLGPSPAQAMRVDYWRHEEAMKLLGSERRAKAPRDEAETTEFDLPPGSGWSLRGTACIERCAACATSLNFNVCGSSGNGEGPYFEIYDLARSYDEQSCCIVLPAGIFPRRNFEWGASWFFALTPVDDEVATIREAITSHPDRLHELMRADWGQLV